MKKPTKPCYVCGTDDWWQNTEGGWACGRCHPRPMVVVSDQPGESHLVPAHSGLETRTPEIEEGLQTLTQAALPPEGPKVYSPEVLELRNRVIIGNAKLNAAFEQLKEIADDKDRWSEGMERWHQANKKLSFLCTELRAKGYEDCLYRDDQGNKTVKCLDGLGCRVCPSKVDYPAKELMELKR